MIHVLQPQLNAPSKNVLGKFVKPEVMAKCLKEDGLLTVDYVNAESHSSCLLHGFLARDKVNNEKETSLSTSLLPFSKLLYSL